MMQTRKRKKSDTQRVPVVRRHSPVFDIIGRLKVTYNTVSSHGFSISPLGRFVNPKITFREFWPSTGLFLFVNKHYEVIFYEYQQNKDF